ncbi:cytochrome P450 4g15-like [Anoplophora glabripennis]|uniref:cytochrome P450 4g15-like n=1 Tax=Anoplophora glabripennis TaxID=217634 RepID=UPI000873BA46|nr:cytochrome P450 4g15-like [Anoplophora glabripennis]
MVELQTVSEVGDGLPLSFSSILMLVLISICTLLIVYEYWFRNLRYVKLGNKMPGPRTIPLLGNAYLAIGQSPSEILQLGMKMYNDLNAEVIRLWLGPKLIVGLMNAQDIEIILGSTAHLEKSQEYDLFQPWLGEGLLISKGEKWRTHRKMIAPTFHSSILKSFMPVFNKNANTLLESLKKEEGKEFDVHDYMSGTTVDTLLETAMGVKKSDEDNTGFEYAMAVMKMCNILHLRHYKFWLRPDFIFKFTSMWSEQNYLLNVIHSLTRQVIKRKKENYYSRESKGEQSLYKKALSTSRYNEKEGQIDETSFTYIKDDLDENEENDIGEKKRLAFLDYMIEVSHSKGNTLTDDEIKEEVDTIMFEGHDTTAAASSFVLSILGVHQDIQEKVFEELKEIFQDNLSRPITFNDTVQMKYLERVILETLRVYPPVPIIGRVLKEDVTLVTGNYTVPAGTTIVIGTMAIHRNTRYYPDAGKFDPDNFLPERCQNRPYYAFIPFSAGPRSCVGRKYAMLKLKVILASVLRKYRTISLLKEEDFKLQADIILKREEGFKIKIEERRT